MMTYKLEKEDKHKQVSEKMLLPHLKAGYKFTDSKPVMTYAIPEWIENRGPSGILLLDDYSRADMRLHQACMELIDRGQYLSWSLPADWHIVMTSNPDDGEHHVNILDRAQRGRYLSMEISFDADTWSLWAQNNHVPDVCINFILMNPEIIRSGPNEDKKTDPRTFTRFAHSVSVLDDLKSNFDIIEKIGTMTIGSENVATFITFVNGDMDKIPDVRKIILSGNIQSSMNVLKECVNPNGGYRADIASVINTRMLNFIDNIVNKKTDLPKGFTKTDLISNMKDIIVSEVLGVDISFVMVNNLLNRYKGMFSPMFADPTLGNYLTKR